MPETAALLEMGSKVRLSFSLRRRLQVVKRLGEHVQASRFFVDIEIVEQCFTVTHHLEDPVSRAAAVLPPEVGLDKIQNQQTTRCRAAPAATLCRRIIQRPMEGTRPSPTRTFTAATARALRETAARARMSGVARTRRLRSPGRTTPEFSNCRRSITSNPNLSDRVEEVPLSIQRGVAFFPPIPAEDAGMDGATWGTSLPGSWSS